MNRNRYRLLFNKLRGLPMAVAEAAAGQGKHPSESRQLGQGSDDCLFGLLARTRRGSACLLLGVAVLQALPLQALAQIVADANAPRTQQPTILNAANGVPQVNIQTPNGNGVSRNTYTQFDVQRNGVILNNSRTDTQTQLGGWVQGNPWLAAGTAKVILNEVNSNNPSLLKGYIEVAGDRAQVVIANPSGISCDGCGFVNANRATLTTGTPVFGGGGRLDAYRVQGGIIRIDGAGMDASRADYTDIIARAVQINAGLWANNLKVTVGANQVNSAHSSITPIAGTSAAPSYAIDVAALGGMYAGKIMLVGTEAGLGVHNAGQIGASAGEVVVTVDGRIENSGAISGIGISVNTSSSLQNSGSMFSEGALTLAATAAINTGASIAAKGDIAITAQRLDNSQAGYIGGGGNVTLTLDSLNNQNGELYSKGDISLKMSFDYTHQGQLQALSNVGIQVAGTLTNQAKLQAGKTLTLAATNLDNTASGDISANTTWLQLSNMLTNRGLVDGSNTWIDAATIKNVGTGRIYGDQLSLAANTITNDVEGSSSAVIGARNALNIGASTINNREHALIFSAGDIAIGGSLDANRLATGRATTLNNASATIEATGNLSINADAINNTNEHLSTELRLSNTESLRDNISGSFYRVYTRYTYTPSITNTDPAQLLAGGDMTIDTTNGVNYASHIVAGGLLNITGQALNNTGLTTPTRIEDIGTAYTLVHHPQSGSCGYIQVNCRRAYDEWVPTAYRNTTYGSATVGIGTSQPNSDPTSLQGASSVAARSGGINLTLPASSLYIIHSGASSAPLIETDARFTDRRTWLGSNYMLTALSLDPSLTQKRLGDGFYEQKLLRDQVMQLTGRRFLAGYSDEEIQYRGLMDAGVTYAKAHNLVPGIALSAAQMAQLTSDIVWLVEKTVTIPNGSPQKVLVPQLYAQVKEGDLSNSGALISANDIQLNLGGNLANAGTIAGRNVVALTAENVSNLGGLITSKSVGIAARNDLTNEGGAIVAADKLVAIAGRDLSISSTLQSGSTTVGNNTFTKRAIDHVAGLYVTGGTLEASAGRDLKLVAANVSVAGTDPAASSTTLSARRDLSLASLNVGETGNMVWDSKNWRKDARSTDVGTNIQSEGNLTLKAGNDINAKAANVTSNQGSVGLAAGRDISITSGQSRETSDEAHHTESSGFLSTRSLDTRETQDQTSTIASTFSGQTTTAQAGRNVQVKGSNVVATQDTTLTAGNTLAIEAAEETHQYKQLRSESESGLFSSGMGFTWGNQNQTQTQDGAGTSHAASTIGSVEGNVNLKAGTAYRQMGSDVQAPVGDINITAPKVDIGAVYDTTKDRQVVETSQSGLSLTVSSPVLSAIQSVQQMNKAKSQTKDPRMKALATANQAFAAKGAADAVQAGQGDANGQINTGVKNPDGTTKMRDSNAADKMGGAKLMLTLGSSSSQSESTQTSSMAVGSTLTAGNNLSIQATDGDLNAVGSTLKAGNDAALSATGKVNLLAAENTNTLKSTHSNSSGYIGIGLGYGKQNGFTLELGFGSGLGWDKGNDKAYTFTTVTAGNKASLTSGKDANLIGASVSGQEVLASIGGNLNIETPQMVSNYASDATSAGFSGSLCTIYCTGQTFVGSANGSMSKVSSQYQSAINMTGIQAGDGGFQVKVGGNTDLKGSVIASTENAVQDGKNSFSTGGTLTLSNLDNKAEYSADSVSGSIGTDSGSAGFGSDSGQASSTTLAGISGIVGNTKVRTGDGANGIAKIFDVTAVKNEINAQTQITGAFGQTAAKAIGDYADGKTREAKALQEQADKETDPQRAADLRNQAKALESDWGPLGTWRIAAHSVIGALTGKVDGAIGAAAGTITAPLVNDALKQAGITGPLASILTGLASTTAGAVAGGTAGAATAGNEVMNNYLSHKENDERFKAKQACNGGNGDAAACSKAAELDALDKQRDTEFHAACDGALSSSAGCTGQTEKMYKNLATYAASDARDTASKTTGSDLTTAHRDEMQSYLDLIKTANADVKTSSETTVSSPDSYKADPYGVVNPNNTRDAYLVMKFGTEALAIGNVNNNGDYSIMTSWWARNGMNNDPGYANGLMLAHVDAAALKQETINKDTKTNAPYIPVDRYTLSYAPTTGFMSDVWGAFLTKIGIESESVQGLRSQMEAIQAGNQQVNWVVHSRGGAEFVQAASGAGVKDLSNNSIVFHAGANDSTVTNFVMSKKGIGDVIDEKNRYRDNSNDLVPQIIGLRALNSPLNFLNALFSAPCLSSTFCTIQQSPHTLPSNWNNLATEAQ